MNDDAPGATARKPYLQDLPGQNYRRRHSFAAPSETGLFRRRPSIPSSIRAERPEEETKEEEDASSVVSEITLNTGDEGKGASGVDPGAGSGASGLSAAGLENVSWTDESGDESDEKEVAAETKSEGRRPGRGGRSEGKLAVSFSSITTARRGNSMPARGRGRRATWTNCFSSASVKDSRRPSAHARPPEDAREVVSLEEVINLKIRVAEQQETIDGLSSRLRDLELALKMANGQLRGACMYVAEELEGENRDLASRLSRSREREAGLKKELAAQKRRADMRAELNTATLDHCREREISLMKELASQKKRISMGASSTMSSHEDKSVATSKSFDKSVTTSKSFGWY